MVLCFRHRVGHFVHINLFYVFWREHEMIARRPVWGIRIFFQWIYRNSLNILAPLYVRVIIKGCKYFPVGFAACLCNGQSLSGTVVSPGRGWLVCTGWFTCRVPPRPPALEFPHWPKRTHHSPESPLPPGHPLFPQVPIFV